ncbi:hypothetical protein RYX36_011823 [Vicia faba]
MSLKKVFRSGKFSRSFKEVPPLYATGDDRNGTAVVREAEDGTDWSTMLPDLLAEIIKRVDAAEEQWSRRQNVVVCTCVCKRWRDVTRETVQAPRDGRITFPSCLKQPWPAKRKRKIVSVGALAKVMCVLNKHMRWKFH